MQFRLLPLLLSALSLAVCALAQDDWGDDGFDSLCQSNIDYHPNKYFACFDFAGGSASFNDLTNNINYNESGANLVVLPGDGDLMSFTTETGSYKVDVMKDGTQDKECVLVTISKKIGENYYQTTKEPSCSGEQATVFTIPKD